jgi:hypothetical protein
VLVALIALMALTVSASPAHAQTTPVVTAPPGGLEQAPRHETGYGSVPHQFSNSASYGVISGTNATMAALNLTPDPTVMQSGGATDWFSFRYSQILGISAWIILCLILISIMHAVVKGSLSQLIRSCCVNLPFAIVGSVMAVAVVQLLLNATNELSQGFLASRQGSIDDFFQGIVATFSSDFVFDQWLFSWIVSFFLMLSMFAMIIVLVLREASVYIATLFLPISFAMLVWPATASWARKLVEFLACMIFSKLIMLAVLAVGAAGIASANADLASASVSTQLNGQPAVIVGNDGGAPPSKTPPFSSERAIAAVLFFAISAGSPALLMGIVSLSSPGGESHAAYVGAVTPMNAGPSVGTMDRTRAVYGATVSGVNPSSIRNSIKQLRA